LFLFIPAVSFSSFFISTDIILLLFWTLSLNELVKIERSQKINNFVLFGIFLGLAFLAKYAAVYFLICLLVYFLCDRGFRKKFKNNLFGFFVSTVCVFIIVLPNMLWNLNNDWITFQHTVDNASFDNLNVSILRGVEFISIQILMVGPFLFLGYLLSLKQNNFNKNKNLLLLFSIPIIIIVSIEAIIVRANANWAAPGLVTLFIFLFMQNKNIILMRINLFFNFIFCAIFFILIGSTYDSSVFNRIYGLNSFAEKIYYEGEENNIVNFVISDRLLFANISYELRDKDLGFYMPHSANDKITNHFQISSPLKKNMNKDFILVGYPDEIKYLENEYIMERKTTPIYLFTKNQLPIYEVLFK